MTDAILQVIFRTLTLEVIKPAKISRYPCAPSIRIFVAFLGGGGRTVEWSVECVPLGRYADGPHS